MERVSNALLKVVVAGALLIALGDWATADEFADPPAPGAEVRLTEPDALRWEILALRFANHELEVERIRRGIEDSLRELHRQRDDMNRAWRSAYGLGLDDVDRREQKFYRKETKK